MLVRLERYRQELALLVESDQLLELVQVVELVVHLELGVDDGPGLVALEKLLLLRQSPQPMLS